MARNNTWLIVLVVLGVIGGVFLIILIVKLMVALINTTFVISGFVVSLLSFAFNILAVLALILAVIAATLVILAAFRGLIAQMNLLREKIEKMVKDSLEKLRPILIASVSQIFLIFVSNDYAPASTKAFLSVMIWILVGIILVSQARPEMKKLPAILASVAVIAIVLLFIVIKYQLYSADSLYNFLDLQWNALLAMPVIDMFSILFVCLALLMLFIVFLYYHIRRKASQ